ncbi:MAG: glycosyltransferase family 4 protein [Gammaproteobacteria bacterium]|nr:glycosyltransferase family 4 protein [Gammaproteobacteria bacterium]
MRKIYFDITDIVEYSMDNRRVSGIQRVQARLISSMVESREKNVKIFISFWNAAEQEMYFCDPADLFSDPEFDSIKFRAKLGLLHIPRIPPKKEVKHALASIRDGKLERAIKKIRIYFAAVFARSQLQGLGIEDNWSRVGKLAQLYPIDSLNKEDVFVILGAFWCHENILDFAKSHKNAGGTVFQLIYDLIPYYGQEFFPSYVTDNFCGCLDKVHATHYVCVSDWTRKDLQQYLDLKGTHVDPLVVPLAHEFIGYSRNHTGSKPDDSELLFLDKTPFVLCVGTIEGRKNISALLKAWKVLVRKGVQPPMLVVAGKRGWDSEAIFQEMEQDSDFKDVIRPIIGPSDKDLAYLYEKCLFTMYPSYYEGWGLPVGEAAWFGKYVIASNATSIPEVCADAIDYIDPNNISSIVEAVELALSSPAHIAEKVAAIRRSSLRSWDDVALQLLSAITRFKDGKP